MIHFSFFLLYALVAGVGFGVFAAGDARAKFLRGCKAFAEFVAIGLLLAWVCYFIG